MPRRPRRSKDVSLSDAPATPVVPLGTEVTGPQLIGRVTGVNELAKYLPATYATYRTIRRHPTIALARALSIAPVVAAEWSVEADDDVDDDVVKFVQDQLIGLHEPLMQSAMECGIDYGWAPFEKVFYVTRDGRIGLQKLKPLLVDITEVLIVKRTGAFNGFKQTPSDGEPITIPVEYAFNVPFRVEGTNWYGVSLLENIRPTYNTWMDANDGAARYDRKLAGSHWVVYYPPGTSIDGTTGKEEDNGVLADRILKTLEASGAVSVPRIVAKYLDQLNAQAPDKSWEITMLSDDSPRQPSFIERLNYLDKLMVRGLLLPERSLLEGQFGTKAEAGVHADAAVTQRDLEHRHVTRMVNWYMLDQLLALNWGEEMRGKVRLKASPLSDDAQQWLREIYRKLLENPNGFLEEFATIDRDALKDTLGVPKAAEVTPTEPRVLPQVPGMDADDPLARSVRTLYAQGAGA